MLTDADWTRLTRYVVGESAPAFGDRERAWIDADAERRAIADTLLAVHSASPGPAPEWNTNRAWARLRGSIGRTYPLVFPTRERTRRRWWVSRIAAAMLILAGGAGTYWVSRGTRTPVMRQLATTRAQRVTLALGDGTTITLGPSSVLLYPVDLSEASRAVQLRGLASFEVPHDARRRLIVRTPRAVTVDVGTTFVVRDYATDPAPRISVVEGEVTVNGPSRSRAPPTRLSRGQVGTIAPAGTITVSQGHGVADDVAWARGELVFRDRPLREVLIELNRWYDIDITLADPSLGTLRITTSFRNESTTDALDAVAAALRLRYEQHGRAVVFSRPRSAHA